MYFERTSLEYNKGTSFETGDIMVTLSQGLRWIGGLWFGYLKSISLKSGSVDVK